MTTSVFRLSAALVVSIMASGICLAQDPAAPAPDSSPAMAPETPRPVVRVPLFAPMAAASARRMPAEQRAERGFLRNAATSSRFKLEASRLAAVKSTDPSVRSYANRLNASHGVASQQLQLMLNTRGMAAPMLENSQRKALNRLEKLDGAKFDREFMAQVGVRYQADEVQMFEKAQKAVKDPVLLAWIDRSLAMLRDNQALAEQAIHGDVKQVRSSSVAKTARQASPAVAPGMPMPPPGHVLGSGGPARP